MKTKNLIAEKARKDKRQSNENFIKEKFELDQYEYNLKFFDFGVLFLDEFFEHKIVSHITQQTSFWKWWRSEWMLWEIDLIQFINQSSEPFELKDWIDELYNLCGDPKTVQSFHLYLKCFKVLKIQANEL